MNKSVLLLSLPSLVIACVEPRQPTLHGDDDTVETETETGTDTDTQTEVDDDGSDSGDPEEPAPSCDLSTHTCVSNVPDGWTGPVTRLDTENQICDGDFDRLSLLVYDGFTVEPAACGCECGPPHDGECATEVGVQFYPPWTGDGIPHNMETCDTLQDELVVAADMPMPFPQAWYWNDTWLIPDAPTVTVASRCDVVAASVDMPDPVLTGATWACLVTEEPEACDAETICVPQPEGPYDGDLCVWRLGDQACPADSDYVHRKVVSRGIEDTRECSECSCQATNEICETASVLITRDNGSTAQIPADGTCRFADVRGANWEQVFYDPGAPSGGACDPSGGELVGTIEAQDTITFCCA